MPKKKPQKGKPEVHKELEGFELNINEFGEITSNMDRGRLNEFLNKHVEDKKFKEREDEDLIRETGSFKNVEDENEDENFDADDIDEADFDDADDIDDLDNEDEDD